MLFKNKSRGTKADRPFPNTLGSSYTCIFDQDQLNFSGFFVPWQISEIHTHETRQRGGRLYITWPQRDSGRLCHSPFWQRTWYCGGSESNNCLNAIKMSQRCYFNIFSFLPFQTKRLWILQYFLPLNRKGWNSGSKRSCLNISETDYRPLKQRKYVYIIINLKANLSEQVLNGFYLNTCT